ncbi:general secretion pathway protein GspB [Vibrio fluvialis]|nr:general secretion pathway protein GspB [Vibrio fluvialis]MBY8035911.1 general secretion pathway protein GspB [Vibrio fluvialis]MBY8194912.1 general secretion pathway protein GspB [Vibrio fluvialis]TOY92137.1 general secretion pathway protein GspB [Vibrio fluvialis]TRN10995.1 general secretion pathway protein GspB [Vibrio fluvialis]
MSQVMKALQRSELSHQQYTGHVMPTPHSAQASAQSTGFRWYHALWLTLPGLATAAVIGYQGFQRQQLAIAEQATASPAVNQVAAPFEQLDYPNFGPLIRTDVDVPVFNEFAEVSVAEPEEEPVAASAQPVRSAATVVTATPPSKPQTQVDKQSQMALSELDLSQLSPEMAARVESILKADDSEQREQTNSQSSQAVPLLQHSDEFSGVLPAMNFQTHVYASNAVKRWIKVNGVEYHEGDNIFDNVQLVAIKPQSTIVRFRNKQIEIPALYDWRG